MSISRLTLIYSVSLVLELVACEYIQDLFVELTECLGFDAPLSEHWSIITFTFSLEKSGPSVPNIAHSI